uniref:Uncharacterized protein n=1 Tax=Oryza nivara TaxID=4536 RepID=A0A0E0GM61_ORYNI
MAPYSQGKLSGARSMLTTPLPAAANVPAHLPLAGKWCSPWAIEEDDGLEAGRRGGAAVLAGCHYRLAHLPWGVLRRSHRSPWESGRRKEPWSPWRLRAGRGFPAPEPDSLDGPCSQQTL